MIHYSKVVNGLVAFIDQDMVQKMSGSWKAWGVGAAALLVARKAPAIIDQLRSNPVVQALGIIDGENIDIDSLYDVLLQQSRKGSATIDIPLIGSVTYSSADVEQLYRCIMER